jgi:hypothetical protein
MKEENYYPYILATRNATRTQQQDAQQLHTQEELYAIA